MRMARVSAALAALGCAGAVLAGELGMKAPALEIQDWVKGDAVDVTKEGTYVVEFWATWCGPCRVSIPHLTELQEKYGDKVTLIGVSNENTDTVKPFVTKQGDKMAYAVAVDRENQTSEAYMREFGVGGIPHAFVVHDGKIVWHDHPMASLERVLDLVVADKFDEAARKKLTEDMERERREQVELQIAAQEYFELVRSAGKQDEAGALGKKLVASRNAMLLNQVSWMIMTAPGIVDRDVKLALEAARVAVEETESKDHSILDTYALALFKNDKTDEAIKTQKQAIKLAEADGLPEESLAEYKERLAEFEAAR